MTNADTYTVMIVEDNNFVRMQIAAFLKDDGYNVIECEGAMQAYESLGKGLSAIIADIRMEPVDGFEFVKHLKSEEITTPVIFVTGDDNPDLLSQCNKWGLFAVLMKPVQKDRLLQTVARAIKSRRSP